jgi:hypothetical protein
MAEFIEEGKDCSFSPERREIPEHNGVDAELLCCREFRGVLPCLTKTWHSLAF